MRLPFCAPILCFACASSAHSWVEDLSSLSDNGSLIGELGYARGYVPRVIPVASGFVPNGEFNDFTMEYIIPPDDREDRTIYLTDRICKPTQRTTNQTEGYPTLQAKSGSKILMRYQENGHVTLLENSGRTSSGHIWIYGTADPFPDDTLMGVYGRWSEDKTGGDHRGVLLADGSFDDGKCYQINVSEESKRRRLLPQRPHTTTEGADLWCGMEVSLPDLASGTDYTLYWVWDFSMHFSDGRTIPEIYTTCIDIKIV